MREVTKTNQRYVQWFMYVFLTCFMATVSSIEPFSIIDSDLLSTTLQQLLLIF